MRCTQEEKESVYRELLIVCVCVCEYLGVNLCMQLCSPEAATQFNLKMKHLGFFNRC